MQGVSTASSKLELVARRTCNSHPRYSSPEAEAISYSIAAAIEKMTSKNCLVTGHDPSLSRKKRWMSEQSRTSKQNDAPDTYTTGV